MATKSFTALLIALTLQIASAAQGADAKLDATRIEQLTGAKGKMNDKEGVFKVTVPRDDLKVTAGGVHLPPALGLTCWAAFQPMGDHVMVMGDQVLTDDQVNPVMSVALDNGLDVTALHNHFAGENPRIMFMHIGGMGDADKLAAAVGKVFAKIKETAGTKAELPTADIDPASSSLDPKKIDDALGHKGELAQGVHKVTIGRSTKMMGTDVGNTMGVNTWAAFAGSDDKAVVDGDFAMLESELQPVLKALRANNIHIVAIHNHLTGEDPRVMFLHFWGIGSTTDLAKGLKAALDTQHN